MSRSHCCPFHACACMSDGVCQPDMLWANIDRAGACCGAEVRRGRDVLVALLDFPTAAALWFMPITPASLRVDAGEVLRPMSVRSTRLCALCSTTKLVKRVDSGGIITGPVLLAGRANGCMSLSVVAMSWRFPLNVKKSLLTSAIVRVLTMGLFCESSVSW